VPLGIVERQIADLAFLSGQHFVGGGHIKLPYLVSLNSSFRGASATSEPGIQNKLPNSHLDSGFGASRRPGMT
jgi:hypothetical protein